MKHHNKKMYYFIKNNVLIFLINCSHSCLISLALTVLNMFVSHQIVKEISSLPFSMQQPNYNRFIKMSVGWNKQREKHYNS